MNRNYILVGKEPKQIEDILEWARQFETSNRIVEQTQIGDVLISTVFRGIDHSFGGGEPLLFETMIFGGAEDGYQERYSTWDEAVKGHKFACEKVNVKE
jgi:hypothetical protein